MPPIVSIVGTSKSGKTTLIERLVGDLKSRGYRVAVIKHTLHNVSLDEPGKDSWRYAQAGADVAGVISEGRLAMYRSLKPDSALEDLAHFVGEDCDLILTEGFKHGDTPKIEVHRREVGPPLSDLKRLVAIVTDEPLDTKARQFSFEDVRGLADLLETGFLKPNRERVSLYVNGAPVTLTSFPRQFVAQTILGMISSLKGVSRVRTLEVFIKDESDKD